MRIKIMEDTDDYDDDVEAVFKRKMIWKEGKKAFVLVPKKYAGQFATVAVHEETGGWAGGQKKAMQRMGLLKTKKKL